MDWQSARGRRIHHLRRHGCKQTGDSTRSEVDDGRGHNAGDDIGKNVSDMRVYGYEEAAVGGIATESWNLIWGSNRYRKAVDMLGVGCGTSPANDERSGCCCSMCRVISNPLR